MDSLSPMLPVWAQAHVAQPICRRNGYSLALRTWHKMTSRGRKTNMNQGTFALVSIAAALVAGAILSFLASRPAQAADEDPPLNLARDGFFSVGGKTTTIKIGRAHV